MQFSRIAALVALIALMGFCRPCLAQSAIDINVGIDAGSNSFAVQAQAINNLAQQWMAQNGGFLTPQQDAQLAQMQANLQQQINAANAAGTGAPAFPAMQAYDLSAIAQGARNSGNLTFGTGQSATGLSIPGIGNLAHHPSGPMGTPKIGRTGTGILSHGGNQILNPTSTTVLSQFGFQQLPATCLDSFVSEAGGMAESIYGDEGVFDIPPFFGMDESHTIGIGIAAPQVYPGGLSTGHGTGTAIGVGAAP